MKFRPHPYQQHAIEHIKKNSGAGLFAEMGLGKTVTVLTAADYFLNETLEVSKILVIAPKKVAESVWSQEISKWEHLNHLRVIKILGPEKRRKMALNAKGDIYVINRENVPWLVSLSQGRWKFDMVIVDESSSFKNHEAVRFKAMKAVLPAIKRIVILSGTPMPNTVLDLWSQIFLLDRGQRLGESYYRFREKHFNKDPYRTFVYTLKNENVEKEITEKISDICISLHAKDYLQLPERIDNVIKIPFSEAERKKYDAFEKEQVLALPNEKELTVVNAAALTNKLLQFASGAIYDEQGEYHTVHEEKLDYLEEIIEAANGHPVLIFYHFKHSLYRILERLKKYDPKILKTDKEITAWNKKEIPVLLAHPASAGHGLNLQAGGNIIVWFEFNWALELYQQGNARLMRQGQEKPVIIHHLLIEDTMDEEVFRVIGKKANSQEALMQAIKAKLKKYLGNNN